MEVNWTPIRVTEPSQPAEARRTALRFASALGFSAERTGAVALAVTELATNLVKHAQDGELLLRPVSAENGRPAAVELLSLDRGPGIPSLSKALRDGFSTSGSPGTGLGALQRVATTFDIYSQPPRGTVVLARVEAAEEHAGAASLEPTALAAGGVSVAQAGEPVCGDGWAAKIGPAGAQLLLVDGLGHGEFAAEAARAAVTAFGANVGRSAPTALEAIHAALRSTRGAAASIAHIDLGRRRVVYAGVGNISGVLVDGDKARHMVSHPGTLGFEARHFAEFVYPWPEQGVLIMHSDGLGSRWSLAEYPGLAARHPLIVAGVLYRDFSRRRDDVTVLVCKETGP